MWHSAFVWIQAFQRHCLLRLTYFQEEKKKDAAKSETDSLLPRWQGEESADKKYYVDSEM